MLYSAWEGKFFEWGKGKKLGGKPDLRNSTPSSSSHSHMTGMHHARACPKEALDGPLLGIHQANYESNNAPYPGQIEKGVVFLVLETRFLLFPNLDYLLDEGNKALSYYT